MTVTDERRVQRADVSELIEGFHVQLERSPIGWTLVDPIDGDPGEGDAIARHGDIFISLHIGQHGESFEVSVNGSRAPLCRMYGHDERFDDWHEDWLWLHVEFPYEQLLPATLVFAEDLARRWDENPEPPCVAQHSHDGG